jgi:hypothetical protein
VVEFLLAGWLAGWLVAGWAVVGCWLLAGQSICIAWSILNGQLRFQMCGTIMIDRLKIDNKQTKCTRENVPHHLIWPACSFHLEIEASATAIHQAHVADETRKHLNG